MKRHFLTPALIVMTVVGAGPLIALLVLWCVFVATATWLGVRAAVVGASVDGAPVVVLVALALLAWLPIMGLVGAALAAFQTFLTGLVLGVIHHFELPDRAAKLLPILPLGLVRFALAFSASLGVAFVVAPSSAPEALSRLGPFSIQFAAAVSGALCYFIALRIARSIVSPAETAQHGS
jgi:hypothetical protein